MFFRTGTEQLEPWSNQNLISFRSGLLPLARNNVRLFGKMTLSADILSAEASSTGPSHGSSAWMPVLGAAPTLCVPKKPAPVSWEKFLKWPTPARPAKTFLATT